MQKLILGTAQFGLNYGISNKRGITSTNEVKKIINCCNEYRINTIDTAIEYGGSEKKIGQMGLKNWRIITKIPEIPDSINHTGHWIRENISNSLSNLKVKTLYGVMLHRPEILTSIQGEIVYDTLMKLKKEKKIIKIGISIYDPDELDKILKNYDLDLVQTPLNILDNRIVESGWANKLHKKGIEIHARSIFLQGLLLMKPTDRPAKFNRWKSMWQKFETCLKDAEITPLEACVRHVYSIKNIDHIIVGVESAKQLREIISACDASKPGISIKLDSNDINLINPSNW